MKKQKKKSLQIVKRIVTLFLILAITSTQIEPSVFAASSDGQWASESLKEDAVTENKSADATADSTGTSNTDEDHTEESETEKKPETTENPAQNPGNAGTTDGSTQNPGNAGTTDGSTQDPGNTGTTDGSTQDPDNTDNTDKTEQDPDNTDNADKTEQDPETTVTEEQLTEETDENLSAADAVLPVEISYYLPKFQELKIEAPEEYTDTEQQEEARAAVTDQAMADETTQKLLEQAEKDAESDDADEPAVDTQALTESAVSEEEYVSYTQMAVTGDTLAAPAVSLPDDVQLDPEADPEDTDPLIGWQVAKLAGIVLSYADGTKINEGDVIPADQINEVSATAADDGIALMSISSTTLAKLVALTQDMTVVQRVGAGKNGKWSILVQGGTVQSDTVGTVRHAYGTLANALEAINKDISSNSFKITLLDDYTADSTDINALGKQYINRKLVVNRTDKPTIVFTGAVNYATSTSYQSWNTLTFPNSSYVYFSGYNPYFTHINIDGSSLSIYGNQNDTSFVDMKFVSGVEYLYGGRYDENASTVNYTLTLDQIVTTADAPIKNLYGGSWHNAVGNVTLKITDSEIYGNVYASGRSNGYTQTGNVTANLKNVAIYRYYNANTNNSGTADTDKDMLNSITSTGGAFWGAEGKVTGNVQANFTGSYYAQYGTWYGNSASSVSGTCTLSFDITNDELNYVGTYNNKVSVGLSYINVKNTTVMNVFGWDQLDLRNCSVAPETHFGRMQHDSSFKKYWANKGTIEAANGASKYTADITSYNGTTWLYSTTVYSTGSHYEGAWNRQRYGMMFIMDAQNVFNVTGVDKDGGNLLYADYVTSVYSDYRSKAKLICAGTRSSTKALKYIKCASQNDATTSVKYITPVTLAGESTYATTASGGYVNAYYTGSSTSDYRIKLLNSSGKVVASNSEIGPLIDYLKTVTASGSYTISVESPYTLNDDDLKAFNTVSTNLANKDVTISGVGTFIAGGEHYQYDEKGKLISGKEEVDKSFRFSRLYPQFKSLKWSNVIFRGDFKDKNQKYTTEYYIHGNGHSLSFENCKFTGPVTIDAGGASGYSTGTSGSTVSLKNCKYVKNVYANNSNNASLGITTLMIDSCTGYEDAPVNIDVARVGTVSGLTVNVNNCKAKIASYYTNTAKITGGYSLNVRDSKVSFVNPLVTTSNIATVALNGDVTLTDTCKGIPSMSGGKSYLRIYGNVKTSSEKAVYLQDFDGITIDGGQLKLGDSANKIEGGLYYSYRRAAVSLENSGKLIFAYMPSYQYYRWIDSLESDATKTELSVAYATTGYPLYVSKALTLPSNSQLRVSTSLMPTHTGTTEYPLIQFAASTNANLNQYTWLADQRYYLAKRSDKIVLLADTYAPMVYQRFTSQRTMTLDANGNQTGDINLYIKDYARNAIDTDGTSINKASNGKYPKGLQVYLSTQDVQKKDGVYGYVYNSSTDIQLTSYYELTSESYTDVNNNSISATSDSPILRVQISSRTYTAGVNYFIYVRDVAGNWSKFLLDTNGPTINYTNVTATGNSDGSFDYTFSGLQFTDAAKEVSYGTSDITDLSYTANATKYINDAKRIKYVRYNKTGTDPWKTTTGSTPVSRSSTGTYTLSNVNLKANEKLYIFAMDGYGNKSKFEFVPITFDVFSNGATTGGKFPNSGSQYFSTLGLVGSTLKSAQLPSNPALKDLAFRYWYKSTDSTKSNAYVTTMKVTEAATYYPLWNYPTLTISNTVTGSAGNKSKIFTYTVQVASKSGSIYPGKDFSYTGSSISGVTAPSGGTTTSNPTSGDLTFGLKHGQSITITLKDYYDSVYVVQTKESEYWTSYTTEGNVKYNSTATKQVAVDAVNRRFAFTNSNDKSQPVVYQSKIKEGTWSESEGNSYKRGINLYIRDLYGSGVDMTGESFTTEEKRIYPSNVGSIGHIYLSPQDAKLVNGKYDYVYDKKTDYLLNDVGSGIWEASTQTDINGNTIPAKTGYPILKYSFDSGKNIAFDQDTNYFIYVRDKTGTWTKFLLDTKGPVVKEQGTVTFTKSGSNYVYSIKNLKFEDEQIRPANGTSSLSNAADEKFSYDANATTYNTAINNEVRYNTTGHDPFVITASESQYKTATNNGDGTYTISNVSLTAGQKLYVFSQDAYGNVSAVQYVPVTFDATEGDAHNYTQFADGDRIKSTLVRKGEKLIADQIPKNPHFTVTTTQKFLNWYVSTDTTNKKKVYLANYVAKAGVTFYANYEMPGITITQSVAGDASNKNQEFKYTVRLLDANGSQLDDNTEILCVGSVIEGSGATSPDIKSLTVTGEYGEVTFKLKHGQVLKLLPGALNYNVGYIKQTDSAGYTCAYKVVGQEAVPSTEAYGISIDEIDGQVDFVNTKNIVVTGISDGLNSRTLPIVGLAVAVVMLGASALMLKRRRRS